MGVIIYNFQLNFSSKMSYDVFECYVTELQAYDFVINDFVIKRGVICAGPHISSPNNPIYSFLNFKLKILNTKP